MAEDIRLAKGEDVDAIKEALSALQTDVEASMPIGGTVTDVHSLTTAGVYAVDATTADLPEGENGGSVLVMPSDGVYVQVFYPTTTGQTPSKFYIRAIDENGDLFADADWVEFESTADVQTALDGKVDKIDGMGLSTNDYTTAEKEKLASITVGSEGETIDQTTHARVIAADTEPEGVNYLWFAPVDTVTEVDVSEVVLETVAYTDTEDKLHVETDGETATVDNSTVADGEVTIS